MPYRFPKGGIAPRSQSGKSWESSFSVASRACETPSIARRDGGPGHRRTGAVLHCARYFRTAVEGTAVVLYLEIDGHLARDRRPGDLAGLNLQHGCKIVF